MDNHKEIMEILERLEEKIERVYDLAEGIMDELVPVAVVANAYSPMEE